MKMAKRNQEGYGSLFEREKSLRGGGKRRNGPELWKGGGHQK